MFTGLIETVGTLLAVRRGNQSATIVVDPGQVSFDVRLGDSVAINGVCLTLEDITPRRLAFTAISETLQRTALGSLAVGDPVNLERAMRVDGRLDGHIVQGHVDGIGRIVRDEPAGDGVYRWIEVPGTLVPLLAEKGSVAVDGISLTIAKASGSSIAVALIPHTMQSTTMGARTPGTPVNIECDVLARYIFHILRSGALSAPLAPVAASSGRDMLTLLENNGF